MVIGSKLVARSESKGTEHGWCKLAGVVFEHVLEHALGRSEEAEGLQRKGQANKTRSKRFQGRDRSQGY